MRKNSKIGSGKGQVSGVDETNALVPPAIPKPIASGEGYNAGAVRAEGRVPPAREPVAEELDQAIGPLPAPPRFSDDPRIQDIMRLARDRRYWMLMRMSNTARLAAEIRGHLQPTRGQEDEWSEDVKVQALEIVAEAVKRAIRDVENAARRSAGKKPRLKIVNNHDHPLLHDKVVVLTARSLADYEIAESATLDRMAEIVATLPIAAFVNCPERKGFSLAGLAIIIGHVGHPLDYPKKGEKRKGIGPLWKRLGLAPFTKDGVTRAGSSWGMFGGLAKEDWIELGYKRQRLGDIFGKITTPLRYAQWRSTGAIGPYGEAYRRYKARQIELNEAGAFSAEAERQVIAAKKAGIKPRKELLAGKLTPMAIERRALRYMTKKLIADLWFAWRRLDHSGSGEQPSLALSTAASIDGATTTGHHDPLTRVPVRSHEVGTGDSRVQRAAEPADTA